MTAPPIVDGLEITQADRDAAAEFLEALGFPQYACLVNGSENLRDGGGEKALLAFARHRTSHLQAASASVDEGRLRGLLGKATPGEWAADDANGESYYGIFDDTGDGLMYLAEPSRSGPDIPLPRERGHDVPGQPKRIGADADRYGEYTRHEEHEANARLVAEAKNALPALLSELARLRAERDAYEEAITASGATKAAYIGEFRFNYPVFGPDGQELTLTPSVPWTTIKEIMAAIAKRASTKDDSHG